MCLRLLAEGGCRWLADCTLYGPAARVCEGVEQWRDAGITTPVLVPLSPDGNQMNGLKARNADLIKVEEFAASTRPFPHPSPL